MRTQQEINEEFSAICAQLGSLEVNYSSQKQGLLARVQELSQEMTHTLQKQQEAPAQSEEVVDAKG